MLDAVLLQAVGCHRKLIISGCVNFFWLLIYQLLFSRQLAAREMQNVKVKYNIQVKNNHIKCYKLHYHIIKGDKAFVAVAEES